MADTSAAVTMTRSSLPCDSGRGQDLGETHQHHDEGDHRHADDVVTDRCPNLQPAAIVSNQKEEILKQR